jgi:hypothetical protein
MSSHDLKIKRAIDVDPGETEHDRHNSRVTLCQSLTAATGNLQISFADGGLSGGNADPDRFGRHRGRGRPARSGQCAGHRDRASELAPALATLRTAL